MEAQAPVYQFLVTLLDTEPPVWRRLQVPSALTLGGLHTVLQVVMGWHNSHLHAFRIGTTLYMDPAFGNDPPAENECIVSLHAVVTGDAFSMIYEYDFGDSWQHELVLEARLSAQAKVHYPRCTAGRGACPPEDCGGPPGYEQLLETLSDLEDPDHQELRSWAGNFFAPELPNFKLINKQLQTLFAPMPARRSPKPGFSRNRKTT
ncbi:plasmid pRiA4b ORF-3 family protein [Gloeobacter violaceus]|uniref:Gll2959 protein n=1 Tax=Gloeobacter violaceus (strain ATCC 29082 / PCC 7421) TaxID=251221 RepID=Q7NCL9_GLOVI|nr:plasmid pRiA4b ORF-3 family protein [Gloeobacter violaceus]BAC90900.1 gll2959 [Gloeobacter violaceus PCC 7421]